MIRSLLYLLLSWIAWTVCRLCDCALIPVLEALGVEP